MPSQIGSETSVRFGTEETLAETSEVTTRLFREKRPKHNATGRLMWYLSRVRVVDPAPLGKGRCRDQTDDTYLSAALAAKAKCLVTYDRDLLDLGKPFGIEIVKPSEFLRRLAG